MSVNNAKRKRAGKKDRGEQGGPRRELVMADEGQCYGEITRVLGNERFDVRCLSDGVTRMGHVAGRIRKKQWIKLNDIVLVSLRDYQDAKVDIIHGYTLEEARQLKLTTTKEAVAEEQESVFDFESI